MLGQNTKVDCKQFISDTSSTLQWIIINNLLHKINHHSKNHTSSLDPKICDGKKKPFKMLLVWLRLYRPRIPDYRGIIALHHSLSTTLTVPCCPNFRAQGVHDPYLTAGLSVLTNSQSSRSKPSNLHLRTGHINDITSQKSTAWILPSSTPYL